MKKIIALLVFVGVLGGVAFLAGNFLNKEEKSVLLYDTFQEKHVHHIVINNGGETIDMKRPWLGEWTLTDDNSPADKTAIDAMIEKILTIKKDQLISDNPEDWSEYEVVPGKGIEVIVKEREDREIAHFWIGKNEPSKSSQYFRKNNLDEIYLVDEELKTDIVKSLEDWKSTETTETDETDVAETDKDIVKAK